LQLFLAAVPPRCRAALRQAPAPIGYDQGIPQPQPPQPVKDRSMLRLFLSHAHENKALAANLQRVLEQQGSAEHPVEVWLDKRELRAGDGLTPEIERAITAADALLVLVTPAALQSVWVGKEVAMAPRVKAAQGPPRSGPVRDFGAQQRLGRRGSAPRSCVGSGAGSPLNPATNLDRRLPERPPLEKAKASRRHTDTW
jgi:hypothetical protein